MPRFVLLEHRWNGVHWDVMLELGDALRTWAIDSPIESGKDLTARLLPDHRLAYLDYEGPVSGDRGEVRRVAQGTYEVGQWSENRVELTLESPQLNGIVTLSRAAGTDWFFRFVGKVD
jgi:hypothetical protein